MATLRSPSADSHTWTFFRAGGVDQVKLSTPEDLAALGLLDQKLWMALSCPTKGLELDARTLELMDADKDGRVRVPELLAAVRWILAQLKEPALLFTPGDTLPLAALQDGTEDGRRLLAAAKRILSSLGTPAATELSVAQASGAAASLAAAACNGDGVVPPAAVADPALRRLVEEVVACTGGSPDRSGPAGAGQANVDAFWAALEAYAAWHAAARKDAKAILPLGEATGAAHGALQAVRAKVDDFFARCRVAAYDPRAASLVNAPESAFARLSAGDVTVASFRELPLAQVAAGAALPLADGLNPAWTAAVAAFRSAVVEPLLGPGAATLTEEGWGRVVAAFGPFEAWTAARQGAAVERLGIERVQELLAGDGRGRLAELVAQDAAAGPEVLAAESVERAVRYRRDLVRLLNNFANFAEFYAGGRRSVFQAGTLYLDGRSCDLCLRVEDPSKHGSLADLGRMYLVYCDCTRPGGGRQAIVAAMTAGDSDDLLVGRHGLFYDRAGNDWDATVVKVVDHPISVGQAFWAPYKRVGRMVEEQVEKFAAGRDKAVTEAAQGRVEQTAAAAAVDGGKPAAQKPVDTGTLAAIGLVLTTLLGAFGTLLGSFMGLPMWKMPFVFLGVLLAVSGPSMLLAWLRLRKRNLAPLLDACGWAVNGRVRINVRFADALTGVATLPPKARRTLDDPFGEAPSRAPRIALLALLNVVLAAALYWWRFAGR